MCCIRDFRFKWHGMVWIKFYVICTHWTKYLSREPSTHAELTYEHFAITFYTMEIFFLHFTDNTCCEVSCLCKIAPYSTKLKLLRQFCCYEIFNAVYATNYDKNSPKCTQWNRISVSFWHGKILLADIYNDFIFNRRNKRVQILQEIQNVIVSKLTNLFAQL